MGHFISVGGLAVIAAVLLILIFITKEVLPLFKGPILKSGTSLKLKERPLAITLDEWGQILGSVTPGGVEFHRDPAFEQLLAKYDVPPVAAPSPFTFQLKEASACGYTQKNQTLVLGSADGKFATVELHYSSSLIERNGKAVKLSGAEDGEKFLQKVSVAPVESASYDLAVKGRVEKIGMGIQKDSCLIGAIVQTPDGRRHLTATLMGRSVDLFGNAGDLEVKNSWDLSELIKEEAQLLCVSGQADLIAVTLKGGKVAVVKFRDAGPEVLQSFEAFPGAEVTAIEPVYGDMSLILSSSKGDVAGFSLYKAQDDSPRLFGRIKTFAPVSGSSAPVLAHALRNKSFAIFTEAQIRLNNYTTGEESLRIDSGSPVTRALFTAKYHRLATLDAAGQVNLYRLKDPHPESSLQTFFGKVWYEGDSKPQYSWESGGGSDEAEAKLSMVPLVFGSIKACIWAMFFAVPLSLLAAVYSSQFLSPATRAVIKPCMEVMASIPSVVIGFLAMAWLQHALGDHVVALAVAIAGSCAVAAAIGILHSRIPHGHLLRVRSGNEWLVLIPVFLLSSWQSWKLGLLIEARLFPKGFSEYARNQLELQVSEQNAIITGIAIGFAVMPIIFTIAEDALTNVPKSLSSASLALGASRWQTAFNVIIPAAAGGIFSAIMIGLGRAVGETIIVLCVAGGNDNTDFNPLVGMRTLSQNLATEIPEAAHGSTLYRALFLGALLLFLFTFVINTLAEVIRQHFRNKNKAL
jgi:phosphate transport system permease protein